MKARADVDIARNLKSIEWLKTELIGGVAELYRAMRAARDEAILDQLANVIMTAYVLCRRLGFDFTELEQRLTHKVQANARKPHDFEEWYGDFSALERHRSLRQR